MDDAPLRELLHAETEFHWDKPQESSFNKLGDACCTAPVLVYYNPNKATTIQCDASKFTLGGALLQDGRPVANTSRALSSSEQNYAQIEKETLAIVHACRKFHHFIFGQPVTVESDHKPLQSIFSKGLHKAPMRLQSMLLRLQPYDLTVKYVPGKDIPLGDTLSRANLPDNTPNLEPEVINMVDHIAITPSRYAELQQATADELSQLATTILGGWPDTKVETHVSIREYWAYRDELSVHDGVMYKGMRFVVPPSMRRHMLSQVHGSHLGIVKCKSRAAEAMFWPGMNSQIEDMVNDCSPCNEYQNHQAREPLHPTKTPDLPWVQVAADIFEWEHKHYLLTIDYFSKYIETDYLPRLDASSTIAALKAQMCRHGVAEELRTDNGPQFSSGEFSNFCKMYNIRHVTSSPHFPRSNGEAERGVQTVKRLWSKCKDKDLALLDYRTTPLESCGLSPAQLCMGRRPRNLLPVSRDLLQPKAFDIQAIRLKLDIEKERQRYYYDAKSAGDIPPLQVGDPVSMSPLPGSKRWLPAKVVAKHASPRSYIVEYGGRWYRRNREALRISSNKAVRLSDDRTQQPQPSKQSVSPSPGVLPANPVEMPTTPQLMDTTAKDPETQRRASPAQEDTTSNLPSPSTSQTPNTDQTPASVSGAPDAPVPPSTIKTRSGRVPRRPEYLQDYTL